MATVSREVRDFIKRLVDEGITRPGDVQKELKAEFGKGLMFKDLGPLLRGHGPTPPRPKTGEGAPRKKKAGRRPGRPPGTTARKTGAPRGRRAAVTPERAFAFVVLFRRDGNTELRGTQTKSDAAREVQSLIDSGVPSTEIALYELNQFHTETTVSIL
ncbi:MAG: hypothetical protein RL885_02285 [Planctomycetota bacterium]